MGLKADAAAMGFLRAAARAVVAAGVKALHKRPAVDSGPVAGVTGTARGKVGSIAAQAAVVDARPVAGLTAAGSDRCGSALRCAVAFRGTPNVPLKGVKPAAGEIMLTAPMAFVGSFALTRTAPGHLWSGWT